MSTSSPPWQWTTDNLPDYLQETWIRMISSANKPALATFHTGSDTWTLEVNGDTLTFPYFVVIQWRAQTP